VSELLDIEPEVRALCEKFGVDHDATTEILLGPAEAIVTVHERNENGHFFILPNGEAAKKMLRFRVKT
jgi:hypothetical protein